jgi:hypothetical protein
VGNGQCEKGFPWQVYIGNPNGISRHSSFRLQTPILPVVKMIDILAVTILAFVLNLIIMWIMNLFSRSTEIQTRLSAVNLKKIEPEVNYATNPVIDQEFSTASGEDLNNQSFLRLMAEEKNLIVLEKERLANELSLVQSQLTDSHSKLQMFQNVQDELATTKSELENNKRVITDITEKNLRLTNEDLRLRRKIKITNRFLVSSRAELEKLQTSLAEQQLDKVHDQLAMARRKLESRNRSVIRLEKKNLRLMRNDKRLRRKTDNSNRLLLSDQVESERLRNGVPPSSEHELETDEKRPEPKSPNENWQKTIDDTGNVTNQDPVRGETKLLEIAEETVIPEEIEQVEEHPSNAQSPQRNSTNN